MIDEDVMFCKNINTNICIEINKNQCFKENTPDCAAVVAMRSDQCRDIINYSCLLREI